MNRGPVDLNDVLKVATKAATALKTAVEDAAKNPNYLKKSMDRLIAENKKLKVENEKLRLEKEIVLTKEKVIEMVSDFLLKSDNVFVESIANKVLLGNEIVYIKDAMIFVKKQ